ncbi:MAG: hypothetical protein JJ916_10145 [Phycisphaerales bacterium]|nr:hypothetical protein [Phycisphaerales bacterium]
MTTSVTPKFEDDCRDAVLGLRGALMDLYEDVGSDPTKPQDVSRKYKLNKNLTWKLARIIQSREVYEAVPLIPGASGMEIFLDTMEKAGASAGSLSQVREALASYESMIEVHVGDRATLELMLDSMGGTEQQLLKSRKLSYQGNTGLWGVRAKSRITAQFLAPNPEQPDVLDAVQIAGLQQVRRLREIPRWSVFRIGKYEDDSRRSERFAIDDQEADTPGLMRDFCRGEMPEIHIDERDDGIFYDLGEGPIGKTGEFSCYFGYGYTRFVPRYTSNAGSRGSLYCAVSMPVEQVMFDLFVHRDLPEARNAVAAIYGKPWADRGILEESAQLPIEGRVIDLGRGANVSTPMARDYPEVIGTAFERAGWDPKDFHCLRLVVEYPPMPSTIAMSIELATRPGV